MLRRMMVSSYQSECHICGMSSHTPTRHEPGNHYDSNPHFTVDPQASKTTQTAHATSSLPVLLTSPCNINMCRCTNTSKDKIPSRPTAQHGTPCAVDLPATIPTTRTCVACPAHSNSPMADPSITKAQVPTFMPVVLHDHAIRSLQKQTPSHADRSIPPPAFMQTSHTLIRPQHHNSDGGCSAPLLPLNLRNAFPDPWSSEVAHTFPSSVRLAALANRLDVLEPLLDITHSSLGMYPSC